MSAKWKFFQTPDAARIEAALSTSTLRNPKGVVVLWPCVGGDARMYGMPIDEFRSRGWHVLLFNPRGHGRSTGVMSVKTVSRDLRLVLAELDLDDVPITAVGHSGGCAAWLWAPEHGIPVERFFLAAPIVDSRRSLSYMYEKRTIREFIYVAAHLSDEPERLREILSDDSWLDAGTWNAKGLRQFLDGKAGGSQVGTLLENLFIPGVDAKPQLLKQADRAELFFPCKDTWYPHAETEVLLDGRGKTTLMEGAEDHYFGGAWPEFWAHVTRRMGFSAP